MNTSTNLKFDQQAQPLLNLLREHTDFKQRHDIWEKLKGFFLKNQEDESSEQSNLKQHLEIALVAMEEMHLGHESILALLLYPLAQEELISDEELKELIGDESLRLIHLLIKTSELYQKENAINSENFHKLLISMAEDIRVILLIIANRFYKLKHAHQLYNPEACQTLATEVRSLYAPIAHKLGLYAVKGEMEDLSLKYLDRKNFDFIKKKLGETKEKRDLYIQDFLAPLEESLNEHLPYNYQLKARTKSINSINNKLKKQKFEDIYDLFAIRIIIECEETKERQACWQAYSLVTDMYQPNPERLKDWVSLPKSNGYESLHITVLGPNNKWVEVQIRTKRMDLIAEQGLAAHWRYKGVKSGGNLDTYLASVRESLEEIKNQSDSRDKILERSRMTLEAQEIYVFTPKGEVFTLPRGATVLDFAFTVHSQVGATAISGKVNGKNVSIKHQLRNGDSVMIQTSPQQSPKIDWLNFVVSTRAKNKIRQHLRIEEEAGISLAKETFERRVKNRKIEIKDADLFRYLHRIGFKKVSDFYKAITQERIDLNHFFDQYEQELKQQELNLEHGHESSDVKVLQDKQSLLQREDINSSEHLLIDNNLSGIEYTMAKCCSPVYGDQIFAFVSTTGIKIHRLNCCNAQDLIGHAPQKIIPARWQGIEGNKQVLSMEVIGNDDVTVITHIISLIKKDAVSLRNYKIDSNDGLFKAVFTMYIEEGKNVSLLIKKIRTVAGVKKIERI